MFKKVFFSKECSMIFFTFMHLNLVFNLVNINFAVTNKCSINKQNKLPMK